MAFIFKHELTHFAETAGESFTLFMNEVMDSQAFKDWVKSKGYADSDSLSATMAMNAEYIKRWKFNGKDAEHKANLEMVADFVGENLFAKGLTRLEQAIKQMQPKTVKTFKEWILNILDKLKSAFQSLGKHTEIETLERDFVRICDEAMKNAEKKQGQKENSTEGEVEYSVEKFWYPNMSKADLDYVKRRAKYELNTTENYIDNITKWLYNDKNGKQYFALYSTEDVDNPTILYACKSNRANFEFAFLTQYFDEKVIDDGSVHKRTEIIDKILKDYGNLNGNRPTNRRNAVGRGSDGGNVTVHRENSRNRPSEALLNCLRNIRANPSRLKRVCFFYARNQP